MGMSAAQARLLSITARLTDNEMRSQLITNSKLRLADKSSEASSDYMAALNDNQFTYVSYDQNGLRTNQLLTPSILTSYGELKNQYGIVNSQGQLLVSSQDFNNYTNSKTLEDFLSKYGIGKSKEVITNQAEIDEYNRQKEIILGGKTIEELQNTANLYLPDLPKGTFPASLTYTDNTTFGADNTANQTAFLNTLNQIYKNSDNSGYYPSWVSNINSALTQINNGKDSNGNTIEAGKDTTKYKDKLNCSPQLNAFSGCTAVKPRELDDIKAEYAKNNKIDSNANFSKYWNSLDNAEVLFNSGDDHWHEETTIKELCNLANLLSALIFGYGNALEGSILDIVGVTSGRTLNFSTLGSQLGYSDNFGTGHLSEIELHTNLVPGENIGAQVANGTESINVMDPGYHEFINNLTKLNSENPNSAKSLVANIIDTFAYVMEIIDIVNSDTSTSSYYHMFADFTDNSGNNCRPVDMEYNNPETDDPNHIFEVTELDPVTGLESTTKKTIWEMNEQSKQDWEYDHATQTSWMRYFADDMFSYNIFSGIAVGENLDAIAATIQQEERENYNREFATWAANCIKQYNDFYTKYQEWLNDYDNLKSQQKIAENKLKEIGTEPAPETEFNFNTDDPKYQWYKNLWYRMGGLTETTKSTVNKCKELDSNLMNNAEWIQFALEHGVITLEQVSFNEKGSITYPKMGTYDWTSIEYGNAADISTTQNEIAIAKAETKYKNALNEIEIEDKKYDSDLKRLETEHTALQTEYDSLKSVIDKNIERSFKAFS